MWGAVFAAIIALFKAFFGRKPRDPETIAAENALAAKQHEAEVLAAPTPTDAELDIIVHDHQRH